VEENGGHGRVPSRGLLLLLLLLRRQQTRLSF
jgi:hypothetical protein